MVHLNQKGHPQTPGHVYFTPWIYGFSSSGSCQQLLTASWAATSSTWTLTMHPQAHSTLGQLQNTNQNQSPYLLKQWTGIFLKYNWDFSILLWFFLSYQNIEHQKALLLTKEGYSYRFELSSELLGWNSMLFSIVSSTKGICTCSVYKTVGRNKDILINFI